MLAVVGMETGDQKLENGAMNGIGVRVETEGSVL